MFTAVVHDLQKLYANQVVLQEVNGYQVSKPSCPSGSEWVPSELWQSVIRNALSNEKETRYQKDKTQCIINAPLQVKEASVRNTVSLPL
jgi:hypothetical protein